MRRSRKRFWHTSICDTFILKLESRPAVNAITFSNLGGQFGFNALSGTALAAPAFADSAIQSDFTRPISIEGETLSMARIMTNNDGLIEGSTVGSIEDNYDVSIILVRHNQLSEFHPIAKHQIFANDLLEVLCTPNCLHEVIHDSR